MWVRVIIAAELLVSFANKDCFMPSLRQIGRGGLCVALVVSVGSMAQAQTPSRQPTRRIEGQGPSGNASQRGSGDQPSINRQPTRRVQGGPSSQSPRLDQRSGQFEIERRVIRPGLRRLPPRPAARWRLGIQVDNSPRGLRISEVSRNSPAFRFGLERGDYLLDVMGYPVGFHGNAYFPLAETLNQTVRRDGWVNILIWNRRTNAEEAMWIQAEPRQTVRPPIRSPGPPRPQSSRAN
jgi:hypothetical protein